MTFIYIVPDLASGAIPTGTVPYADPLRVTLQPLFDAIGTDLSSVAGTLPTGVLLIANELSEFALDPSNAQTNLNVYDKTAADLVAANAVKLVVGQNGLYDPTIGDLWLAGGNWLAGNITGGVVRAMTSLQMAQTYTQTVAPIGQEVGNAVRFVWNVTATDNDTGHGPVLTAKGQLAQGATFQIQGHLYVGANQDRFSWSPIGYQTQWVYGNLLSAGNMSMNQGWDVLSARTFLTDTHTVSWGGPDSALGGASFTDNQLHLTQNGGIAALQGSGQNIISYLSIPFLLGNQTKSMRIAYDVADVNNGPGGDAVFQFNDAQHIAALAGVYPGIDAQNLILPYNVGVRIQAMTHGDHRLGIQNGAGHADTPLLVTLNTIVNAVTTTVSTSTFNKTAHGFTNGEAVVPSGLTNTTGFAVQTIYYIVNATANTFQLAKWPTAGGPAIVMGGSNDTGITVSPALPSGANLVELISLAPITLTATPTLAPGAAGETVKILNIGAQPITLQDISVSPNSNLSIATTGGVVTLAQYDSITVRYSGIVGAWLLTERSDPFRGQPTVNFPSGGTARFRDTFGLVGVGIGSAADTNNVIGFAAAATGGAGSVIFGDGTGTTAQNISLSRPDANSVQSSAGFSAAGMAGSTSPSRWIGGVATAFFTPSGTHQVGDYAVVATGQLIVCIVAGTPGQFVVIPNLGDITATFATAGGWFTDTNTWTFVSQTSGVTTFSVAVDATAWLTPGTKVSYNDGGGVKYGVVASSTFLSVTTVVLMTNDDNVMANHALTAPRYSYQANPQGFPAAFNWTPTLSGWSANPTNVAYQWSTQGRSCTIFIRQQTAGTSGNVTHTATLPVAAATVANMVWGANCRATDNGTTQPGTLGIASAATTVSLAGILATSLNTATGSSCVLNGQVTYQF